ncbi:MAG: hypothetical protein C4292_02545, partial [Nitrososphaera sp.]
VAPAIEMRKATAMLGDGTVAQVDTFDPQNVQTFYQRLTNTLGKEAWLATGISRSATDDLHRLFCQFSREAGGRRYRLSGYFGVQFHALPYYKADRRVAEIQKELALMSEKAAGIFQSMTSKADKALEQELEKRGYASLGFEDLFTKMFEDEELAGELGKTAAEAEGEFPEFQEMRAKKDRLFAELNDLTIELYQTSNAFIDYNRLMQGEEGVCTYFDVELVKKSRSKRAKSTEAASREAVFETAKIPEQEADEVAGALVGVARAIRRAR